MSNCYYADDNATPKFTNSAVAVSPTGLLSIKDCSLPANFSVGGNRYTKEYPKTKRGDKNVLMYRFVQTAIAAATSYTMSTEMSTTSYILPLAGNVISVNAYYSLAITAGTFTYDTRINNTPIANLSTPYVGALNAATFLGADPFTNAVISGDELSVHLYTTAGFLPTGDTLVIEVLVAV